MIDYLKKFGWTLLDIAAFVIIFALIAVGLSYVSGFIYDEPSTESDVLSDPIFLLVSYTPLLIASLIATWLVHSKLFARPFYLTGLVRENLLKDYTIGFVIGILLISFGFLTLRLLGFYDILDYHPIWTTIFLFFVFFIVQSFFEEVAFRSYLMPALEARWGLWVSLIVSSILFTLIHLSNSNITALGVSNIFLAGLLLGLLFVKYGNVWAASGLHCSWNYFQSTIFGFEVSGEKTFSLMETEEVGPDLITGGAFGFEGSLLSVLFLTGLIIFYLLKDDVIKERLTTSTLKNPLLVKDEHIEIVIENRDDPTFV